MANPGNQRTFSNWVVSGNVVVANPNSANTTITVTGPGTVAMVTSVSQWNLTLANGQVGESLNGSGTMSQTLAAGKYAITAGNAAEYTFANWSIISGAGTIANPNANSTTVTITQSCTVQANYNAITYPVTLTNTHTGFSLNCAATANQNLPKGTYPLVAGPVNNYTFSSWNIVSGSNVSITNPASANTIVNVDSACTINANYTQNVYSVVFGNPQPGWALNGSENTPQNLVGGVYPIVAGSANYYHFTGWTASNGNITFDNAAAISANATINGPGLIEANYALTPYTVTLSNLQSGWTLNNQEVNNQQLTFGTYELYAGSVAGYNFAGWTISGAAVIANTGAASTTVTVEGPCVLTGNWSAITYSVNVVPNGAASLTFGGGGSGVYNIPAGQYPIACSPPANYSFAGWSITGNISVVSNVASTTVNVGGAGTIEPTFAQIDYAIQILGDTGSASTSFNGVTTGPTTFNYPVGTYQVYGNPATGWSINGCTVTGNATVTGLNPAYVTVTGDCTVQFSYFQNNNFTIFSDAPTQFLINIEPPLIFANSGSIEIVAQPGVTYYISGQWTNQGSLTFAYWLATNCTIANATAINTTVTVSAAQVATGAGLPGGMGVQAVFYDGGGGGGGGCVEVYSLLPDGSFAKDVEVNDTLELSDAITLESSTGIVSYSKTKPEKCVRITTENGTTLVCSLSAPIPTNEGILVAPLVYGKLVATRHDVDGVITEVWDKVVEVNYLGLKEVQHISVDDKCFWAGEQPGKFILHHNKPTQPINTD